MANRENKSSNRTEWSYEAYTGRMVVETKLCQTLYSRDKTRTSMTGIVSKRLGTGLHTLGFKS